MHVGREQIADCTVVNVQVPDEVKRLDAQLTAPDKLDGSIVGPPSNVSAVCMRFSLCGCVVVCMPGS